MTPEAAGYLARAQEDLDAAHKIAAIGSLAGIAARSAYFATFHAAQALIVEWTGKIAKTHSGVRSEFGRLARERPGLDRTLSTFLAKAYSFKEIADYHVSPAAKVSNSEASEAIEEASRFVERVAAVLAEQ